MDVLVHDDAEHHVAQRVALLREAREELQRMHASQEARRHQDAGLCDDAGSDDLHRSAQFSGSPRNARGNRSASIEASSPSPQQLVDAAGDTIRRVRPKHLTQSETQDAAQAFFASSAPTDGSDCYCLVVNMLASLGVFPVPSEHDVTAFLDTIGFRKDAQATLSFCHWMLLLDHLKGLYNERSTQDADDEALRSMFSHTTLTEDSRQDEHMVAEGSHAAGVSLVALCRGVGGPCAAGLAQWLSLASHREGASVEDAMDDDSDGDPSTCDNSHDGGAPPYAAHCSGLVVSAGAARNALLEDDRRLLLQLFVCVLGASDPDYRGPFSATDMLMQRNQPHDHFMGADWWQALQLRAEALSYCELFRLPDEIRAPLPNAAAGGHVPPLVAAGVSPAAGARPQMVTFPQKDTNAVGEEDEDDPSLVAPAGYINYLRRMLLGTLPSQSPVRSESLGDLFEAQDTSMPMATPSHYNHHGGQDKFLARSPTSREHGTTTTTHSVQIGGSTSLVKQSSLNAAPPLLPRGVADTLLSDSDVLGGLSERPLRVAATACSDGSTHTTPQHSHSRHHGGPLTGVTPPCISSSGEVSPVLTQHRQSSVASPLPPAPHGVLTKRPAPPQLRSWIDFDEFSQLVCLHRLLVEKHRRAGTVLRWRAVDGDGGGGVGSSCISPTMSSRVTSDVNHVAGRAHVVPQGSSSGVAGQTPTSPRHSGMRKSSDQPVSAMEASSRFQHDAPDWASSSLRGSHPYGSARLHETSKSRQRQQQHNQQGVLSSSVSSTTDAERLLDRIDLIDAPPRRCAGDGLAAAVSGTFGSSCDAVEDDDDLRCIYERLRAQELALERRAQPFGHVQSRYLKPKQSNPHQPIGDDDAPMPNVGAVGSGDTTPSPRPAFVVGGLRTNLSTKTLMLAHVPTWMAAPSLPTCKQIDGCSGMRAHPTPVAPNQTTVQTPPRSNQSVAGRAGNHQRCVDAGLCTPLAPKAPPSVTGTFASHLRIPKLIQSPLASALDRIHARADPVSRPQTGERNEVRKHVSPAAKRRTEEDVLPQCKNTPVSLLRRSEATPPRNSHANRATPPAAHTDHGPEFHRALMASYRSVFKLS